MAIEFADESSIPNDWRTRQPGLTIWLIYAVPRTLLQLLFYSLYYIPSSLRQNSTWTYRQALKTQLVKTIYAGPITECGYTQALSLEAGKTGDQWVVLKPASPNFYRGPFASSSTVSPEILGGTWYPDVPPTTAAAADDGGDNLVILSFHSGSFLWITGRPSDSGFVADTLNKAVSPGTRSFWPQYRLAGARENSTTYPGPMQDAITAYVYLVRDLGISPRRIVLAGDSSGGTIAMALLRYLDSLNRSLHAEDASEAGFDLAILPPPRACLMFSPSIEYTVEGDSRTAKENRNGRTDYCSGCMMAWGAAAFAPPGIVRLDDPYLSPALHPFATPVPLFVQAGGGEVLCDSIRGFAEAMSAVPGNTVEYMEVPVLLLGGHGKIALYLTPLLLARAWSVTSVVRNAEHESEILKLGEGHPGKVSVLLSSLDDVKTQADAQAILDKVRPEYVVWAAGAGGKGGAQRTYAIDQDAAKHFISSSFATPSVTKFLLISHMGSRKTQASWIPDAAWERTKKLWSSVLPDYARAKWEADQLQTALAAVVKRREPNRKFQSISLRPGLLTDEPATGKVELGRVSAVEGSVSREDVAIVADRLLARDDTEGWIDLLGGQEPVDEAVERVAKGKIDAIGDEDVEGMIKKFGL
ncbi:hypothetical protein UA08_07651 [Talaromyces atroroseus]|uniref:Alpha/beta hydrolase fold-3 domain-containing protein n=1 Tax=Talaromyces atroroseus TaxID=1441469 RepID=A0A225AB07_TALAT|nr:hypothetical protein UA08_07651 [Talaromyces atroroseus]OKL57410.1 hypothetical protein UA08_07651 [Talaromyces atroroseus]